MYKYLLLLILLVGCSVSESDLKSSNDFIAPNKPSIGACHADYATNTPVKKTSQHFDFKLYTHPQGSKHIMANSAEELSFASGYVFAEKNYCALKTQLLLAKGESARVLGAHKFSESDAPENGDMFYLINDLFSKTFEIHKKAQFAYPKLSTLTQVSLEAYAKGIHYFAQNNSVGCEAFELSGVDIYTHFIYQSAISDLIKPFIDMIAHKLSDQALNFWQQKWELPAYAFAFGRNNNTKDASLAAGTHRFYDSPFEPVELQMIIPGHMRVYGVSSTALPYPQVGFNDNVAWTLTPALAPGTHLRFRLKEAGNNQYIYNNTTYMLDSHLFEVPYKVFGGGESKWNVVLNSSHLGWAIKNSELHALKENLTTNTDAVDHWFEYALSKSVFDIKNIHLKRRGLSNQNTIAVDQTGRALYINSARVFHLNSAAQLELNKNLKNTGLPVIEAMPDHLPKKNACNQSVPFTAPMDMTYQKIWSTQGLLHSLNQSTSSVAYGYQKVHTAHEAQARQLVQKTNKWNSKNSAQNFLFNEHSYTFNVHKSQIFQTCRQLHQEGLASENFCSDIIQWNGDMSSHHYLPVVLKELYSKKAFEKTKDFKKILLDSFQLVSELNLNDPLCEHSLGCAEPGLGSLNNSGYKPYPFMTQPPLKNFLSKSGLILNSENRAQYPVNFGPSWLMQVEFKNNKPQAKGLLLKAETWPLYKAKKLLPLSFYSELDFYKLKSETFKVISN